MPHLILEHSEKLTLKKDLPALLHDLHFTFAKQETVKLEAVKTRSFQTVNNIVGDGSKPEHVFLRVYMLKGRSEDLKNKFTQVLLEILKNHLDSRLCCLCIELCELQNYYTER